MFPDEAFAPRYFAPRYFPRLPLGDDVEGVGGRVVKAALFVPGVPAGDGTSPRAAAAYVPGASSLGTTP